MATEALDLPRNASITIRLPHRLRVMLRALRLAAARLRRRRRLAELETREMQKLARRRSEDGWIEKAVLMHSSHSH